MASEPIDEKAVFNSARRLASPDERMAYLKRACGQHADALRRILELFRVYDDEKSFLESPPLRPLTAAAESSLNERPGQVIGCYQLLEQIGEGGFGVVFMAEQTEPVRRKVALKILKPGMDTQQVVARFEAERQALAIMDHPNIAKVFDGGSTGNRSAGGSLACANEPAALREGRPYFVMELIKGVPITEFCDQNHLSPRQRLELFIPVCLAVQHAHQKGVIHRDLKPSNVLVTVHDTKPVPKVIDFGIAKALGHELTDKTQFTGFAQMVGTPLYMSPEQAGQSGLDIDTRSDIYSLGVLLYELLTGTTPFTPERFKDAGYDEIRRIIREEEPPTPSTRISTLGQAARTISLQRQSDPKRLGRLFRGELDWIVMKCLEKDRGRRYESAGALSLDVQRYLDDEPVQACPPSASYRFRKFARRNKVPLAVASIVLLCLVLLGGGFGWMMRDRAAQQASLESQVTQALDEAQKWYERDRLLDARAAVNWADARLAQGTANEALAERVRRWQTDLDMADTLEEISLQRTAAVQGRMFDVAGAGAAFGAAFRNYGIDLDAADPETAADRIRTSALQNRLVAALDDWIWSSAPDLEKLIVVLRRADDDPWRNRLRDALHQQLRQGTWKQHDEVVEKLARDPAVLNQPPATVRLMAYVLEHTSNTALAVDILRQAQRRHPADLWINHQLAWNLVRLKPAHHAEAVGFYRLARAQRPNSPGIRVNLGLALHGQLAYAEAEFEFREAVRLKDDYALAYVNLARALRSQKRYAEAIKEARKAVDLKPQLAVAHVELSQALRYRGDIDAAIAAAEAAIQHAPKMALAHGSHGFALMAKRGQLDAAIAAFERSIALEPELERLHFYLGEALADKGRYVDAIAAFQQGIRLKPDEAAAHTNLGNAFWKNKQVDEAIAEYRTAIFLNSADSEPHYNLGIALRSRGQLKKAIAAFEEAVRVNSDHISAYDHLGMALQRDQQVAAAVAAFRRGIAHGEKLAAQSPKDGECRHSLGAILHNLATALADQKELTEARQLVIRAVDHQRVAVEREPDNRACREFLRNHYWVWAECSLRLTDHAEAAKAALELPGIFPDTWQEHRRCAGFLARCVALASRDHKLGQDQQQKLGEKYGGQAVAMLRQAVGKGFRNVNELRTSSELAPLRSRPDFQDLARELETNQKQPAGEESNKSPQR